MSSMDTKDLKESIVFGVIFATVKAGVDYLSNKRKPSIMSFGKNSLIAASVDIIYDEGKKRKWW